MQAAHILPTCFLNLHFNMIRLDIRGMNVIRLIPRPIHAPSHETNTPPTTVISKKILVELLGIREECFTLFLGYKPISLF
jgi:hypothetical protein